MSGHCRASKSSVLKRRWRTRNEGLKRAFGPPTRLHWAGQIGPANFFMFRIIMLIPLGHGWMLL
ncbi:hypothetical protein D8780_12105 [Notoacmeibacter ruber]|uniref:Uncharacterized protein n=1 Tax=Notoacmeibacter ruber TaxID=2670375 RepID=A0A3L7JEH0_9HYPH|nr:hypothetical protein D8780_12105 [Notoacmeibacter ruber]